MASNPVNDPLHNPGVNPAQAVPGYGEPQVNVGTGQEQQREFTLPSGPTPLQDGDNASSKTQVPSPMQMMGNVAGTRSETSVAQISSSLGSLQDQFSSIRDQLQDASAQGKLTPQHYDALKELASQSNGSITNIANLTQGQFQPPAIGSNNVLKDIINWVNGGQQAFGHALNYLSSSDGKQMNVASMFKLQYSVQRASQKAELFASVISSTVSGIKTIMSTQLG